MEEIDEFIKLNEEYERKISELYQKHWINKNSLSARTDVIFNI